MAAAAACGGSSGQADRANAADASSPSAGANAGPSGVASPEGGPERHDGGALHDGGSEPVPVTPAGARCVGTAFSCEFLATRKTDCAAQHGCDWTAPACDLAVSCSVHKTSIACEKAPGCATDFTSSTCKEVAGYCAGTTRAACERRSECIFSGGCEGQAIACDALRDDASCNTQGGCSWQ